MCRQAEKVEIEAEVEVRRIEGSIKRERPALIRNLISADHEVTRCKQLQHSSIRCPEM